MPTRILLIDGQTLFRSGARLLLQSEPDFQVVAEAGDGVEGLRQARELKPDVVLLELKLPDRSGLETLRLLRQDHPSCAVLVLTASDEPDERGQALRDGAYGYLLKNIDAPALVRAVRRAAAGETVVAESMAAKRGEPLRGNAGPASTKPRNAAGRHRLTARETQVVQWLARGASNKVIARELDVSESTVKIHVQNVLKKLNLTRRVQVAVYAVEHGFHNEE